MYRHELTDRQWQQIAPLIRRWGRAAKRGDRNFVNAVVYVLKTGAPWRDLPERFGPWKSVYNRFSNWAKAGRWGRVWRALQVNVDRNANLADATVARAHQDAAGAKGGPDANALGRSRGGFSTKIHALTDAPGRPLHVELTPGQSHEATAAQALIEAADARAFIGDTGYDSERIRQDVRARGIRAVIPSHPTRA